MNRPALAALVLIAAALVDGLPAARATAAAPGAAPTGERRAVLAGSAPGRPTQADVRVRAILRSEEIRVGESAVLEISVETDGAAADAIELPPLPTGLTLGGSRDYTQLQFSLPGGRSRSIRREFFIVASSPGIYQIPAATVTVRGNRYRTAPLRLHVLPAAMSARAAASDEYVRLRASVEPRDTVYVGQQVTYRLEALYTEPAQVRNQRTLRYGLPRPPGFWLQELPAQPFPESRVLDGRPVEVQWAEVALFPIEPGTFHVPPGTLRYDVRRGFLQAAESRELATDSVRVVVLPVPEADRPAGYDGAVGRYRIDARLEPARVPAGEAAVLRVAVQGTGNVRGLPPPRMPEIAGLEVYAPAEETEITVRNGVVGGTKSFSWVLVPAYAGDFELPQLEYAYFDPESGSYDVATVPALRLRADAGGVADDDASIRIRDLKAGPHRQPLRWVATPAFLVLQLVPLAALGWIVVAGWRRQERRPGRRALLDRLRTGLRRIRDRAATEPRAAADDLARFVPAWIADRLDLSTLRPEALQHALIEAGVDPKHARSLAALLERIDRLRYAAAVPDASGIEALVREAGALLEAVHDQVPAPRRSVPVAGAAIAFALLLAGCAAGGATTDAERAFRDATVAYAAGEHDVALAGFREAVRARPSDANAWYNLGNAHYSLGQTGHAVWAWSTAAGLRPRDADVRENLRRVAPSGGAPLRHGLPLSREEALLILALGWWSGFGGLLLYLRSGRRNRLGAGAAGLVLGLMIFLGWAIPRTGNPGAIVLDPDTALQAAPAARSEVRARISAGAGVDILEIREEWARVRSTGGEGWVLVEGLGRL